MKKQGTVIVSFSIAPDGEITQVALAGSSGVDALDKAAMAAVEGVEGFESFPDNFTQQ